MCFTSIQCLMNVIQRVQMFNFESGLSAFKLDFSLFYFTLLDITKDP